MKTYRITIVPMREPDSAPVSATLEADTASHGLMLLAARILSPEWIGPKWTMPRGEKEVT